MFVDEILEKVSSGGNLSNWKLGVQTNSKEFGGLN